MFGIWDIGFEGIWKMWAAYTMGGEGRLSRSWAVESDIPCYLFKTKGQSHAKESSIRKKVYSNEPLHLKRKINVY